MKRIVALFVLLVGMLTVAAPAAMATHSPADYGNPDSYDWRGADENNDSIVVFHHNCNSGTNCREKWNNAKNAINDINTDLGGEGIKFIRDTDTALAVEAKLMKVDSSNPDCPGGYWRADKEGLIDHGEMCEGSINNPTAKHEALHGAGLIHRPCEYASVSLMMAGIDDCQNRIFDIGPADIELLHWVGLNPS